MKKSLVVVSLFLSVAANTLYAQAMTCTDIKVWLTRGYESSNVLALQNFLYEKGYMKVTPNGYFGPSTFAGVKAYQKALGVEQVGSVGPMTRNAIKKDSCGEGSTTSGTNTTTTSVTSPTVTTTTTTTTTVTATSTKTTAPVVVATPKTPVEARNAKRREDILALIQALGKRFADTRGAHSLAVTEVPIELCVKPVYVMPSGTTTEVAVLATPDSPCKDFVDISYLEKAYLATIPRDPLYATSSVLTGYTITRSEYNDITIVAKNPEEKAIIKVTCNFNSGCQNPQQISSIIYSQPSITSIDRPIFLRDSLSTKGITVLGKGFTTKNKVTLISTYTLKEYVIGEFISENGTTTIITPESLNQSFVCGYGCSNPLPLGDYMVKISNEGGTSNTGYINLKGYTTTTISSHGDTSVTPKSTNVKVGSITLSSSLPLTLKTLVFNSTSSSSVLPSKITNFVLKDTIAGTSINGGSGSFSFANQSLAANQSKVYDVYVDVAEVLLGENGFITYGGILTAVDPLLGTELTIPTKQFSFTVSY